jgi:hypothetical protein
MNSPYLQQDLKHKKKQKEKINIVEARNTNSFIYEIEV